MGHDVPQMGNADHREQRDGRIGGNQNDLSGQRSSTLGLFRAETIAPVPERVPSRDKQPIAKQIYAAAQPSLHKVFYIKHAAN
jgi:hypothetical protein